MSVSKKPIQAEVAVLGSGPGGYTAAFRAADLGLKTVLIERYPTLGGVCLNVGCIPSKALLHAAKVISDARDAAAYGIEFGAPSIDRSGLLRWKDKVLSRLTQGLEGLAGQRQVTLVQGTGQFSAANRLSVATAQGTQEVEFEQAIIAVGSTPINLPDAPQDERLMNSTTALTLPEIPPRLLVIGGGSIGLELAAVYHELGSRITVVELLDGLMAGADPDLVKPLQKRMARQYENIFTATRVTGIEAGAKGLTVGFAGPNAPAQETFDLVLLAVGRAPTRTLSGPGNAGVQCHDRTVLSVQ